MLKPFLIDIIQKKTNLDTEIIDCLKFVNYDESAFDPEYIRDITPFASIGVGLAIRRLGD